MTVAFFQTYFPCAHEIGTWMACAVFCKTKSGFWYAPREELRNLNVDAYFPDGVWCHRDLDENLNEVNYYCQNNICMPEYKPSQSTIDVV